MRQPCLTRIVRQLAFAACAAGLLMPMGAASTYATTASDLLPDLQMAPLYNVYLQTTKQGNVRLRFGTLVNNIGDGPLIVRGSHRDRKFLTRIVQNIRLSDGTTRGVLQPNAVMYFEPLGVHDHFHIRDFITMRLTATGVTDPPPERLARKIGFCLEDSDRMPVAQRPPNATSRKFYDCGTRDAKAVRMGISVGWGDAYQPWYQYQAIDVTGLPAGTYRLCAIVNPQALWLEESPDNNTQWIDVELDTTATTVNVVDSGATPCDSPGPG